MNKEKYFETIKSLKFLAKKEVGQNFLIDAEVCERIIKALNINPEDKILEIGCGAGSLSVCLTEYSNEIVLIDIDEALLTKVKEDFKDFKNVKIQNGNAMNYDYSSFNKIVGNLPYYITSGIIEKVVLGAKRCETAVFMVQKEAADRLLEADGKDNTTPMTLLLHYICKCSKLFNVSRNSFVPAPHIDSTVIRFNFDQSKINNTTFETYKLVKTLFLNKRKTILNNLKNSIKKDIPYEKVLFEAEISPTARPQTINFEKFINLYSVLKKF